MINGIFSIIVKIDKDSTKCPDCQTFHKFIVFRGLRELTDGQWCDGRQINLALK